MNEQQKQIRANMKVVGKSFRKKDAMQLLKGKPVFTEDVVPVSDALIVKCIRSPYAHALIEDVNTDMAMKVPGIVGIWTYKDVSQKRYTTAGQTYPEPSAHDRVILDQRMRFVGDAAVIVAGETEKAVDKAMKLVKIKYQVLEPVLDMHTAKDNAILVHPEDNWEDVCGMYGADQMRNLVASGLESDGDVDAVMADCDEIIEHTFHVKAAQQAFMEPFVTYCEIDRYSRLHIISSTQIVFHCRRNVAAALDIPQSMVRVEKPRIGGGFGAKQTVVAEVYPAFVTWVTKRPSIMKYTREECQIAGSPRHEMEVTVKLGASKEGKIRAFDVYTLSNSGAYSDHGPTTVGLSGHKSIPLYTAGVEAFRFGFDVVYTNLQAAGAYRGYGATQGQFAVETCVNELAERLHMDPIELRMKNIVREGMIMPAYYGEPANACALDKCIEKCAEMMKWNEKPNAVDLGNGKIRAKGMAISMQGSAISGCDVGSATVKLNEDGHFTLHIGAADMGTGCDTTLAQIVAEVLEVGLDDVVTFSADTDVSPYDSGSYASSTAYITGKACEKAAIELKEKLTKMGAEMLETNTEEVEYIDGTVRKLDGTGEVTLAQIANKSTFFNNNSVFGNASCSSPVSPPPFMCGMVEVDVDKETGTVEMVDFYAVVDCGTPLNPAIARVQTEGGLGQGIGMTLFENVQYNPSGSIAENSLMQYKIPSRIDMGRMHVEFEDSYEPTSAYGVKSIGEIVINTPAPAITHAVYNATGVWHRTLPITPEKVLFGEED